VSDEEYPEDRGSPIKQTAMCAAAAEGELGVCRFLWAHGAASTIRTTNSWGEAPMHRACKNGHLDTAKWLFDVGAGEDILTTYGGDETPILISAPRTIPECTL